MRIIAGTARGRTLFTPVGDDIRPTSDKVRGAIFNALKSRMDIEGAVVLDCFCGSGALGLEALSRGAAQVNFIDDNRDSLDLAKKNAKAMKFENQAQFLLADMKALKPNARSRASLVFLDPPYNKNLVPAGLASLVRGGWLADDALCIAETEKNFVSSLSGFHVLADKTYGNTRIHFLQLIPAGNLAE
jgi:16S rRNA (guanine966-N2)-methyltransferase